MQRFVVRSGRMYVKLNLFSFVLFLFSNLVLIMLLLFYQVAVVDIFIFYCTSSWSNKNYLLWHYFLWPFAVAIATTTTIPAAGVDNVKIFSKYFFFIFLLLIRIVVLLAYYSYQQIRWSFILNLYN